MKKQNFQYFVEVEYRKWVKDPNPRKTSFVLLSSEAFSPGGGADAGGDKTGKKGISYVSFSTLNGQPDETKVHLRTFPTSPVEENIPGITVVLHKGSESWQRTVRGTAVNWADLFCQYCFFHDKEEDRY